MYSFVKDLKRVSLERFYPGAIQTYVHV